MRLHRRYLDKMGDHHAEQQLIEVSDLPFITDLVKL